MPFVIRFTVRFADLDALDHVNHATILTYCETARCDWFQDGLGYASMADLPFILASAHVEYKAPIPKTAKVEVHMSCPRIGSKSFDLAYVVKDPDGTLFAEAKTVQVCYDYQAAKTVAVSDGLRASLEAIA